MTKTKKWRTRVPRPIGHEFYDPFDYSVWRVTKHSAYVGIAEIEYDVEKVSRPVKFKLLPPWFSVQDPWHAPSSAAKCVKHDVIDTGTKISECRVCRTRMEWTTDMTWAEAPLPAAATGDGGLAPPSEGDVQFEVIPPRNFSLEFYRKMFGRDP